eukprot:TRINITY_DN12442_c4_g2_i1.p1 TRINITY_DN12442_c4_g2~~TRINITY_DN12442_c4_g2_i1.p1  ORF type:complete len:303 (+),score=12.39 TRINITY_DN12442_c4_g2_i1:2-910(+)
MAPQQRPATFWAGDQVQSLVSSLMYGVGCGIGFALADHEFHGVGAVSRYTIGAFGGAACIALVIGGYKNPHHYVTSGLLGTLSGIGSKYALSDSRHWRFGAYTAVLGFFHCSEYVVTAYFNYPSLSFDSFLINHSRAYHIAAVVSWAEYWLEAHLVTNFYSDHISVAGLAIAMIGELFRKLAMITAGSNFKHLVATEKEPDHQLVRSGVYRLCRHPSYAGWFWWAVGTQVLLCNPISTMAYAYAAVKFFKDRIYTEEYHLLMFFRQQYVEFQDQVPTGVPFVQGYLNPALRRWLVQQSEQAE